jgi:hypothetical protein
LAWEHVLRADGFSRARALGIAGCEAASEIIAPGFLFWSACRRQSAAL